MVFWQYRNLNNYKFKFERSLISRTENLPSWAALFAPSYSSELWNATSHLGRQSRDLTVPFKAPTHSMGSDQAQNKPALGIMIRVWPTASPVPGVTPIGSHAWSALQHHSYSWKCKTPTLTGLLVMLCSEIKTWILIKPMSWIFLASQCHKLHFYDILILDVLTSIFARWVS